MCRSVVIVVVSIRDETGQQGADENMKARMERPQLADLGHAGLEHVQLGEPAKARHLIGARRLPCTRMIGLEAVGW
jgi:hypothetical protein